MFYDDGDPSYHASAPLDPPLAELWDLQGNWGGYLGTPIAPGYFLTATHIGGTVGQQITFSSGPNTGSYTATAFYSSPSTDLTIWKIDGVFPSWVPLIGEAPSGDDPYSVFGRGTRRGAAYEYPEGQARGWLWGPGDSVKRWGTGLLGGDVVLEGDHYLYDLFDGPGAIQLSVGDSGGSLFILRNGTWELAGIHYAVTGPYSETLGGSAFNAALYDSSGLYTVQDSNYTPAPPHGAFFSTSVFAELAWINSVIVPEPSSAILLGLALALPFAARTYSRLWN